MRPSRARGVDEGRQGVDLNFVYCHARFLFMVPVFLRPMSVNFFLLLSCLLAFFFRSIVNPLPQCMQRHIRFINSCFIHVFALFLVHLAKRNSLSCPASTVILCCNARFFILFLRHHLISIVYGIWQVSKQFQLSFIFRFLCQRLRNLSRLRRNSSCLRLVVLYSPNTFCSLLKKKIK